jgi:hypothetical protein
MEVSESLMDALTRKCYLSHVNVPCRVWWRVAVISAYDAQQLQNILVFSLHGSYSLEARWYVLPYFWPSR